MNTNKLIRLFFSLTIGMLAVVSTIVLAQAQALDPAVVPPTNPEYSLQTLAGQPDQAARLGNRRSPGDRLAATADTRPPGDFDIILLNEDFAWNRSWQMREVGFFECRALEKSHLTAYPSFSTGHPDLLCYNQGSC